MYFRMTFLIVFLVLMYFCIILNFLFVVKQLYIVNLLSSNKVNGDKTYQISQRLCTITKYFLSLQNMYNSCTLLNIF